MLGAVSRHQTPGVEIVLERLKVMFYSLSVLQDDAQLHQYCGALADTMGGCNPNETTSNKATLCSGVVVWIYLISHDAMEAEHWFPNGESCVWICHINVCNGS